MSLGDPGPNATKADEVCVHGTAMDVHCCNCHSGFIFEANHECPPTDSEIVSSLRDLLDYIGFTDPESHANPVTCVKIVGEEMFQLRQDREELRKILQPGVSMVDCPLVETAKKLVEAHQAAVRERDEAIATCERRYELFLESSNALQSASAAQAQAIDRVKALCEARVKELQAGPIRSGSRDEDIRRQTRLDEACQMQRWMLNALRAERQSPEGTT